MKPANVAGFSVIYRIRQIKTTCEVIYALQIT